MNLFVNMTVTILSSQVVRIKKKYIPIKFPKIYQVICIYIFAEECSPANIGTEFVYNGHYYTELKNPTSQNYQTALSSCTSKGGFFPTIRTQAEYNDAKIIAGKFIDSFKQEDPCLTIK